MGDALPPPRPDDPFVGREDEIRALRAHLAAAEGGRGRIVLVSGEAGIGKTRLVEELLAAVPAERALWGRCRDGDGAPAFGPWRDVLLAWAATRPDGALRAALGAGTADVGRVAPALLERLGIAPSPPSGDDEAARFQLLDALAELLVRAAAREPLAIALDDLHWADGDSLQLLRLLGTAIDASRLLVIGTFREAEMRQAAAVPRILADLSRIGHRLSLRGLAATEVADFAAARARPLPDAILAQLYRATEGNPLFVKHLVALLARAGTAEGEPLPLPTEVRDAVRGRLAPLAPPARRLLGAAAVLGRDFELAPLARLAARSEADALADLAEPIAAGLVQEVSGPGARFRFTHALVRDTLYDELDRAERVALHHSAGQLLEARLGFPAAATLGDVASHYFRAEERSALERAVALSIRAGDEAQAALGCEEAIGHYQRALEAQRSLGAAPAGRLGVLLSLLDALVRVGDLEGIHATALEAADLARAAGDGAALARAALGYGYSPSLLEDDPALSALLEDALAALGADDSPLRARLLARLVLASYYSASLDERRAWADEAVAVARRVGDGRVLSTALRSQYYTRIASPDVPARLAMLREAIAAAESAGDFALGCEARANVVNDRLELGDVARADAVLASVEEIAERYRLPRWRWRATILRAIRALQSGELGRAEELSARAAAMGGRGVRPSDAMGFHAAVLFGVRRAQGRLAELRDALVLLAERPGGHVWRSVLAVVHAETGEAGAARPLLTELAVPGLPAIPADWSRLPTLVFLADACAAAGDDAAAAALSAALEREAPPFVMSPAAFLGSRARPLGALALVEGRIDDAIALLEEAVAENERVGARVEATRARCDLVRALEARGGTGDAARADDACRRARATAQELGLGRLLSILEERHAAAAEGIATLRRTGATWTIAWRGESATLRDAKGLLYLRRLLRAPGAEVAAVELASLDPSSAAEAGGATRPVDAAAGAERERARLNVTRALRATVERIARQCPAIAHHLQKSIHTGGVCSYRPPPGEAPRWEF